MFTRNDTKVVKGIAIILMLMHHLWAFPERLPTNMQINIFNIKLNDIDLLQQIGMFGKICVPIFMFLGGYGLYKKCKKSIT